MKLASAEIISTEEITPGVVLLWLKAPQIAAETRPGQFVMARCGTLPLRRPFSIHQRRDRDKLALLTSVRGKGTLWLSQLYSGATVDLLGPLGNGFHIDPGVGKLLLIAGGLGVAPLAFLAQEAITQGYSVVLLYGAATVSQLYPVSLLHPEIQVILATEDGSKGRKGRVTDLLSDLTTEAEQVFACGPLEMYQTLVRQNLDKSTQVSLEVRLGCGLGACFGCSVETVQGMKKVCKDGPVFKLGEVIWSEVRI